MLGVVDNKFTIGKEVYYPFAVELHYSRVDKKYWSICFERIKRAGFRILSTSVPWNLHQDSTKDIDFSGFNDPRKDLIVFLELAREFGFKIILRPGPSIAGQWPNGGLPQFLFSDLKLLARDSHGQELRIEDDNGVPAGYLPSYLHPQFQHSLRNYFKTLIETTKNYIHPRGPIFMVELDFETSFGHYLNPASADYNPELLARYYPEFLASCYEDIRKLNQLYREKAESFERVEPPRNFSNLDMRDLPKVFDWFRFREHILKSYLSTLEDIFKSYAVAPLFFRSLYFRPGDLLPAFDLVSGEKETMLGANIFPEGTYFDLVQKGRFLKGEYKFAWASSFVSGSPATEQELQVDIGDYSDGLRRFYLVAALMSGYKGFNHYMFVDRDHWYGAPLAKDGTISSGYEIVKMFNAAILTIKLNELEGQRKVCIIGNRQYQWLRLLDNPKQFGYIERLMVDSASNVCRDLMRLKLDYDIRENLDIESLNKYSLVFIPLAEFMPASQQEAIVSLLKKGINVIACGLMPKYDESFRECHILSRHLRIKTSLGNGIDLIKMKNGQFTSYVYGHILSTDSRIKKLATADKKNVGVASSKYKGTFYLFSFNIGSGGDHNKLVFLESLLAENDITSFMYCSDPSVDMLFQRADKRVVLYMVAPPPGELSSAADTSSREVIIRLDLRKMGIVSAKIKMTDLLAGESATPLKVSSDSLRKGIPIKVDFPDGKMFLLETK
ncbi:MAG: beta-galactosidase [candidate division Zixibacteria bacterium]|nr:beta-galactosidase [candidate division Zixibacteria bacterium]